LATGGLFPDITGAIAIPKGWLSIGIVARTVMLAVSTTVTPGDEPSGLNVVRYSRAPSGVMAPTVVNNPGIVNVPNVVSVVANSFRMTLDGVVQWVTRAK
jgi:hypothetical protein